MSPRRAVAIGPSPMSTVRPVPSSRRGCEAGSFEPLHQLVRGPEFLEGEFRVRMQVTAEIDQFRQQGLQPRPHQGGGLSFSSVIAHRINSSEAAKE